MVKKPGKHGRKPEYLQNIQNMFSKHEKLCVLYVKLRKIKITVKFPCFPILIVIHSENKD